MRLLQVSSLLNLMTPFYGWGSTVSRLQSHYEETVYFLPFSSQEILVLNWLTSEKDEKLSWPWSLPVVLKPGPMEYESSTLTTRLLILFHNCNFSHWFTFNLNQTGFFYMYLFPFSNSMPFCWSTIPENIFQSKVLVYNSLLSQI